MLSRKEREVCLSVMIFVFGGCGTVVSLIQENILQGVGVSVTLTLTALLFSICGLLAFLAVNLTRRMTSTSDDSSTLFSSVDAYYVVLGFFIAISLNVTVLNLCR